MPKMYVSRSIAIHKPASDIYPHLNNFRNWIAWSPWLLMEPDCTLDFESDNKSYGWTGNRVGSGNMKVNSEVENQEIHYDLNFLKPWKSSNKTSFYLKEKDGITTVEWTMNSRLPFFMAWMKKSMTAYIGADYERGLDMLKSLVETGEIHSKLEWKGESSFEGCKWIGLRTKCAIDNTPSTMLEDFGRIRALASKNMNNTAGAMFSIYHKWDIVKNTVEYTACLPVIEFPDTLPGGFVIGEIKPTKTYSLRHTGSYQFVGNAWSTLYTMHRQKEFKPNKQVHPFEIYHNSPHDTAPKDLVTEIHFAVL